MRAMIEPFRSTGRKSFIQSFYRRLRCRKGNALTQAKKR